MVVIIGGVTLGIVLLVWIWKVPVRKFTGAMIRSGSNKTEAWVVLILLVAVTALVSVLIAGIL